MAKRGAESKDRGAAATWWTDPLRRQGALFLAALAAGAVALYFNYAERWSEQFRDLLTSRSPWLPPLFLAAGMVAICRLRDLVFPGTDGTGIPQAIAALKMGETPARSQVLSARVAIGKVLLLTLAMFAGATVGREGPSVHVAACFLYLSRRFAPYPQHLLERGLIVAGGAAGIGAAFNTPVAAIIFAIEEIGRSFEKANAGTIVRTTVIACALSWLFLSNYLFYGRIQTELSAPEDWWVVLAIGVAGGFLGGAFSRAVIAGAAQVRRWATVAPWATAGGLGIGLGLLGVASGGESYGGGFPQAHAILMEARALPVWYPFAKAGGLFLSLTSAIPGGLFDPTLSIGSALGEMATGLFPGIDRHAIILLAMGAYFAGVVQSPITAAVILVEMTAADRMLLPLLATTIAAYEASRLVCPTALYEALSEAFLRAGKPAS